MLLRGFWQSVTARFYRPKTGEAKGLLQELRQAQSEDERSRIFQDLLAVLERDDSEQAIRDGVHGDRASDKGVTRDAILTAIASHPELLSTPRALTLITEEIGEQEFGEIRWQQATDLVDFYATLYSYSAEDEEVQAGVREQARLLLHAALKKYEREQEYERLIQVLRMVPSTPDQDNLQLRHVAELYELRRVRRARLWLYRYLILQVLLVVIIFPLLFMNAENGAIQRQIEETANVELGDEGYRLFSYPTALYWSVVTATSIGYGDITPLTNTGRIIAAVLGTMGVVTIGIVAGLILRWITPRDL